MKPRSGSTGKWTATGGNTRVAREFLREIGLIR